MFHLCRTSSTLWFSGCFTDSNELFDLQGQPCPQSATGSPLHSSVKEKERKAQLLKHISIREVWCHDWNFHESLLRDFLGMWILTGWRMLFLVETGYSLLTHQQWLCSLIKCFCHSFLLGKMRGRGKEKPVWDTAPGLCSWRTFMEGFG